MSRQIYTVRSKNFSQVIRAFLDEHKSEIKFSTYAHYVVIAEKHLLPVLGKKSVANFSADDANCYIESLSHKSRADGTPLAPKTVRDIVSLLKLVLKFAEQKNFIFKVQLDFKLPRQQRPQIKIFTPVQQKYLEVYLLSQFDTYRFGVYLCLYTGLRIGEICALQWKDIDFSGANLSVSKTILRVKNVGGEDSRKTKLLISSAKTRTSRRVIPLPHLLIELLQKLKEEYAAPENCYLLTGIARPIEPRNYYERYKCYLRDCGLSGFNFHALRHTFATRCIELGVDAKVLSEILGHASVKITLDRYVHPSVEVKRACLERLFAAGRAMGTTQG